MASNNITRQLSIYINDKQVVNSLSGVSSAIRSTKAAMANLKGESENYDAEMAKLSKNLAELTARQSAFKREINGTKGIFASLKDAIGPVGASMLAAFSVQAVVDKFISGFQEAFDTIVNFNQKQADLAAIMGKSQIGIRNLTADAIKFGSSTAYSATEVSELQMELAKLGKTEPEIRKMTLAILNSATALESGLGEAAELVGGQLNSFQEDASQAQKYADIMANSVNISATSFESLSTALPKVSAVAYESDVSFEKLNATLGTLADQNIAAETAGTGFRNILLTAADAGVPYEELLQKIKGSTNQLSTATGLFGKENATVAVILANSTDKVNANTKALENSAGAADKLAREKMKSLKGAIDNFAGAWEGFLLSIEDGNGIFAKIAKDIINIGTAILTVLNPAKRLSDELRDEQIQLNVLVSRIKAANVENGERARLLVQLKDEYPDYIEFLGGEKASNEQLEKGLIKVNEQYVKRIALQKQQQKIDDAAVKVGEALEKYAENVVDLQTKLAALNVDFKLNVTIDDADLLGSADRIKKAMKDRNVEGLWNSEAQAVSALQNQIRAFEEQSKKYQSNLDNESNTLTKMSKILGIQTEAQKVATEETKKATKVVADKSEIENALIEKQIKDLTYLKNRREAAGKDTYNAQAQIYRLQQQLYKNDKDKYEEATVGLIKLETDKNTKIAEAKEKADKVEADRYKKFVEDQIKKAKAVLDLYLSNNQSKINDEIRLTQLVIDEEVKRLEGIKQARLDALEVEKRTSDEVIAIKRQSNIALSADDLEYLAAKQNYEVENVKATEALKKQAKEQDKQRDLEQAQIDYELSLANAETAEEEERLRREKAYNDEKARYKKLLEEKKITASQFTAFVDKLDKDQKAAERSRELSRTTENLGALNNLAGAVGTLFGQSKELALAQAAINGAMAITSILAQMPKFDGGFMVAAAIATAVATTAAQIKQIQKQKAPKRAKFFDGGYTGTDVKYPDDYGGVTQVNEFHGNEWVMPEVMLRQPRYANVAGWLERERKAPGSAGDLPGTGAAVNNADESSLAPALAAILHRLENPVAPNLVVGYDAVKNINKMNEEITASGANGKTNTP